MCSKVYLFITCYKEPKELKLRLICNLTLTISRRPASQKLFHRFRLDRAYERQNHRLCLLGMKKF